MTTRNTTQLTVMSGLSRTLKTLTDGTLRFAIDIDAEYRDVAMHFFSHPATHVAIARLNPDVEKKHRYKAKQKTYRKEADVLQCSNFFRTPKVWRAIGTTVDFVTWLQKQPCAHCGVEPKKHNPSEISYIGVGGIIKPEYSAIPLCHDHLLLRKSQGNRALGSQRWFEKERLEHVCEWVSDTLLRQFNEISWIYVKPSALKAWAVSKQVATHLPAEYGLAEED